MGQQQTRLIVVAGFAVFVLALVFWPDRKPVPEVLDNIYCAGEAIALSQYADTRASEGDPLAPEVAQRVTAHMDKAVAYLRGLRRRDDPAVIEVNALVTSAQTTGRAMIERDPDGYVQDVLSRIDICAPKLSEVSSL